MKNPWRTAIALLGQAILLACPAQLQALTTLSELSKQVENTQPLQGNALTFHTDEAKVLVLANHKDKIGAVLLHSKTRKSNIAPLISELQKLITHNEQAEVYQSADKHAAIILYPKTSEPDNFNSPIVGCNRLTALCNACELYNANTTPHFWHDSGISLRNYDKTHDLLYEITLDMSAERVEYAEIRLSKKAKSFLSGHMLTGITPDLPKDPRQVRKISYQLGGATPIHADEDNDIFICRDKNEVYTVGSRQRLLQANKKRRNIKHYLFPELPMPDKPSPLIPEQTSHPEPQPPQPQQNKTTIPANTPQEPQAKPQPLTPAEARRTYIEQLQEI